MNGARSLLRRLALLGVILALPSSAVAAPPWPCTGSYWITPTSANVGPGPGTMTLYIYNQRNLSTEFADVTGDGKADAIVVNDWGITVRRNVRQ